MGLINEELSAKLQAAFIDENKNDQLAQARVFNPYANGEWWLIEQDPDDPDYLWIIGDLGYGAEIGSVLLSELESLKYRMDMTPTSIQMVKDPNGDAGLEIDILFKPTKVSEVLESQRTKHAQAHMRAVVSQEEEGVT